jgi:MFS transporter, DHA1 family, multidrug resistance protein
MLKENTDTITAGLSRGSFIAMIAALMALNALAIDIMLPAFPLIASDYGLTGSNRVQFVLAAYFAGFGLAQVFFGPVSDRFGRRSPLFAGLILYVCFAIAGAFAPTFELLLVARFLQGVGAAATRVIALAIVRDTHSGRAMASVMSLVMMVFMIVPVIAPLVGQAVIMVADWHWVFLFMGTLSAAVSVLCYLRLPETLGPADRRPLSPGSILEGFRLVLSNSTSMLYTLSVTFFFGSLFGFLNVAQPVYVDIYGLGALFPLAFASIAILMGVSSFANSKLVGRYGQRRLSHAALIGYFAISAILAAISFLYGNPPFWLFMALLAVSMPLFGLIGSNFNSIAMEPLGAVAGTASSVIGFCQTAGGAIVGAVIGQMYNGTVLPLAVGFTTASAIALVFVVLAERGRLFGQGTA